MLLTGGFSGGKKVLPIKIPVPWSELAGDWLTGLWYFCGVSVVSFVPRRGGASVILDT